MPAATTPKTPTGGANATADRAIEILLLFTEQAPAWSAPEIAAHFDMPRSTAYRYLGSLRSHSLIVQDSRGSYTLGPRLLQMAQVAKAVNPALSVALPHLRELAERFKENVVLNECIGTDIMSLERIQSPHHIVLKSSRTHMLPWPATGSAKVFLAFASDAERARILAGLTPTAYTEHTIPTLAALEEHLGQVKAQGHAVSDEERDEGVWGASVPVFDAHGCRYAISVLGPKFRIAKGTRAEIIKALEHASQAISNELR